jgi:Protein of unknown function (DUF2690)
MRVQKRSMLAMSAVAAVSLAILAPATAASAAPAVTCSGHGCDFTDPETTGCANTAITAESANIYVSGVKVGWIQLRYSTACRTVWARVVSPKYTNGGADVVPNTGGSSALCGPPLKYSSTAGGYSCYTAQIYDGGITSYAEGTVDGSPWYATLSY